MIQLRGAWEDLYTSAKTQQEQERLALIQAGAKVDAQFFPQFYPGSQPPTSTPGATAQQQTQPVLVSAPSKPWYMTWWGIGLIAGGAFFTYKKFIAK